MQNSLGIYIEKNIIKYAKLQKDKDLIKVEAYNVAFYDNDLENTLNKIISETYSYKVPISINVSDEIYTSFEVSSLLNKQDAKKAINIEYDMLCNEKGYSKPSLEHKYLLVEEKENPEKQKTISIIANKNEISKKTMAFNGNKVSTITPITTSIANLLDIDGRENIVIVNIESKTKITTIIDGQIYQVDVLDEGMGKILDDINKVENSISKSYDVCKNMTIYTQGSSELYSETNEYMDIVTSTLYNIVSETKRITSNFFTNIDKIYITGLGTCINNIDLYFQDYISSAKCEILKPYFVNASSMQIPIKDYIEVNSAIALALDGLGVGNKNLNFAKSSKLLGNSNSNLSSALNKEINLSTIKNFFENLGNKIKEDFSEPLQSTEKLLIRGSIACVMIAIVFTILSGVVSNQIERKKGETIAALSDANAELDKLNSDISTIASRTETYENLVEEITNPKASEPDSDGMQKRRAFAKDSIPNLLNRIMFVIPKKVKLTSIKNTTANHIVIRAEAEKYEQLGYFKAVLSTNGILQNVKSTSGQKSGTVVEVTIEGDLP